MSKLLRCFLYREINQLVKAGDLYLLDRALAA